MPVQAARPPSAAPSATGRFDPTRASAVGQPPEARPEPDRHGRENRREGEKHHRRVGRPRAVPDQLDRAEPREPDGDAADHVDGVVHPESEPGVADDEHVHRGRHKPATAGPYPRIDDEQASEHRRRDDVPARKARRRDGRGVFVGAGE